MPLQYYIRNEPCHQPKETTMKSRASDELRIAEGKLSAIQRIYIYPISAEDKLEAIKAILDERDSELVLAAASRISQNGFACFSDAITVLARGEEGIITIPARPQKPYFVAVGGSFRGPFYQD